MINKVSRAGKYEGDNFFINSNYEELEKELVGYLTEVLRRDGIGVDASIFASAVELFKCLMAEEPFLPPR